MRSTTLLLLFLLYCSDVTSPKKLKCKHLGMGITSAFIYLDECAKNLEKGIEKDVVATQLLLGIVRQSSAQRVLKADKLIVDKIVLKESNYTTLEIGAKEIKRDMKLEIIENPYLTTITIPKTLKGHKLTVRGNRMLSKESLDTLKAEKVFDFMDLQTFGECKLLVDFLVDFSQVDGCFSITGKVFLEDRGFVKGKPQMVRIGKESCVRIYGTKLRSIAFLDLTKATKTSSAVCSQIESNPHLCISEKQKKEIKRVWPDAIEDALNPCNSECLADDVINGTVPAGKTCSVIRGDLVLKGLKDSSNFSVLTTVAEIRGGGLKLLHSTINAFTLLPNLIAMDMENKTGPAIEISNNNMTSFDFPYLLKIDRIPGGEPLMVIKDNKGLNLSETEEKKWKELTNGQLEVKLHKDTSNRTNPIKSETAKNSKSAIPWIYVGPGVGVALFILGSILIIVCIYHTCCRKGFRLQKVRSIPSGKRNMVKDLVNEILEMNPFEWRQITIDETQQRGKASAERANQLVSFRTKYSSFLDKIMANPPLTFRPPREAKDYEIYAFFRKIYKKDKGKNPLILLSKNIDPSISIAVLPGKQGEEQKLSGIVKEESSCETTRKDTSMNEVELGGTRFDINTKLLKIKKYNDDITLYTYEIRLGEEEPSKPMIYNKFKLVVANYHTWSAGPVPNDRTTILKLLDYSKKQKTTFAVCSGLQTFTFLMSKALFEFITNNGSPKFVLQELRMLLTDQAKLVCTPDDGLNFCLMMVLEWAKRENLVPKGKENANQDFCIIYEKLIKYMFEHPTTLFFEVKDLGMDDQITARVMASNVLTKRETTKEQTIEPTISVAGNVGDSDTDNKGNDPVQVYDVVSNTSLRKC